LYYILDIQIIFLYDPVQISSLMRKDEMDERIIRLEQELRTLKAVHREGVDAILSELKTFQDSVIAEKVESVRTQLAEGYERMIACLLVRKCREEP